MIAMFNANGAVIYVDEQGAAVGYEDVFTEIEMCRKQYAGNRLGAEYVDQFIR